jgi:hypothetical protein
MRSFKLTSIISYGSVLALAGVPQFASAAEEITDTGLTEIVVTAEKYNSTIQNTPISMSALSGAQLDAAGITSVEQLAHEIPGLSMRSAGPGQTEYEARGLSSSAGAAPTVGFYLDEIPLSPPSRTPTASSTAATICIGCANTPPSSMVPTSSRTSGNSRRACVGTDIKAACSSTLTDFLPSR